MIDDKPEYIHLDQEPTVDDVRALLKELCDKSASKETKEFLGRLSVIPPNCRLALNLNRALSLLSDKRIDDVLKDGLTDIETAVLLELDRAHFTQDSRTTARALMNVKERWIVSKALSGVFAKSRASSAYIDVGGLE